MILNKWNRDKIQVPVFNYFLFDPGVSQIRELGGKNSYTSSGQYVT